MVRKATALCAALLVATAFVLAGCGEEEKTYSDGVYSAEFVDFDSYGYKDFMRVTVTDGVVVELLYDGLNPEGGLKSEDEKYQADMEAVQQTYPKKYTSDLVNQYLENHDIGKVDTVAGATYSSDSFRALFTAIEESMVAGSTDPLVVENVPVR